MRGLTKSACGCCTWALRFAMLLAMSRASAEGEPGGSGPLRFVVYGGSAGGVEAHRALVAQILKLRPELVVHAGGMVANGHRAADWDAFDEVTKPLRAACPFFPCRGGAGEGAAFPHQIQFAEDVPKARNYYSFDRKGAHFVVLDSYLPMHRDDPQTRWLGGDLDAAQSRPAFVFYHAPMLTVAGKPTPGGPRLFWHPLFVRHKVRAVFAGGHHLYYRTAQDGVPYIVTGGGGAPLDEVIARRNLLATDVAGSFHHFIEFRVSGPAVRGRVVDTEGKTRDEFILPPAAGDAK